MKSKTLIIIIIAVIIIFGIAYYLISPAFIVKEADEQIAGEADIVAQGQFKPDAHEVAGKVLLLQEGNKKIIRFEDFETINGPDLHIYLSSDLEGKDFIDLGKIKATKGNVNYEIPQEIDIEKYNKVLIWCVPFKVLFSYAELN